MRNQTLVLANDRRRPGLTLFPEREFRRLPSVGHLPLWRRRQLAIVPRLFRDWVEWAMTLLEVARKPENPGLISVRAQLIEAECEAYAGMDVKDAMKVSRRVAEFAYDLVAPYRGQPGRPDTGANMTRMFLQLVVLSNLLIEEGHLEVIDGGTFDRAFDALKNGILDAAERDAEGKVDQLLEISDPVATKHAAKMRRALADLGIFPIEEAA